MPCRHCRILRNDTRSPQIRWQLVQLHFKHADRPILRQIDKLDTALLENSSTTLDPNSAI